MLTAALRALVDRFSLKNERIGEVAAGAPGVTLRGGAVAGR